MSPKTKDPKKLAFAICEFLNDSIVDGTIKSDDAEGMEVAIQCISESFGFDFSDEAQQKSLSIKPAGLATIFDVFVNTQKKVAESKSNQKDGNDNKAQAEAAKTVGNKLMAEKKYKAAIAKYTEAIELDASNAVYYANRAAAYSQDGDHANAVEDSKLAIEVDPDYSKAYSRMGHAYFCLGNYTEAIEAYEMGLKLDPTNASMKQSLASAKGKIGEVGSSSRSAPSSAGNPFAGGAGGMPDLGSMLSNPEFMKMASNMMQNPAISQMMKNPAVAEMAQNMMKDPSSLAGMMNDPAMRAQLDALGGAGGLPGAAAGGLPSTGSPKKNKKKK
ncbi:UNVERIFIED_CONTAM: hypothetical protein HDU68_005597 [Siphonaria sp. JEL0065]|nr:hypothetical protein HDU68_005597 [Siphonaria sp. JEL0065]